MGKSKLTFWPTQYFICINSFNLQLYEVVTIVKFYKQKNKGLERLSDGTSDPQPVSSIAEVLKL